LTHLLLFLFIAAAWGASFLFMRLAVPELGALPVAFLRLALAGLLLSPAAWASRQVLRQHWRTALWLGLLNGALPFSLFSWSMHSLPAGHGSILNATTPLWVALTGLLFFGRHEGRRVWWGLLLALAGVAAALQPWQAGVLPQVLPSLAILTATFCYGFATHLTARLDGASPLAVAWCNTALGAAMLALPAVATWPAGAVSLKAWIAVLGLGVVSTALAWWAFYRLFRAWGPLRSTLVTYLIPFFAFAWGWLFLHEAAQPGWWLGLALVLGGLALAGRGSAAVKAP
jgi:drug/metabolite transporter (DMT)-like permease